MRVLVAEDEPAIAANISAALTSVGFVPEIVADGEAAWFRGETEDFALIILDLGLPTLDGLVVLKRWRAAGRRTPVLVLTARAFWAERVEGIDSGADDYLTKPFRMEELTARARALIRRSTGLAAAVIEAGPVTLDTRQMRVSLNGIQLDLTSLEYRLVAYMLHHKGRVITASELLEHIYGSDSARDANALEALVVRVRRKLGPQAIETRRGLGYCVPDEPP